jgi:hypothetical protein
MFHVVKISEMIKMTVLTKDQMPFTSNKVTHQSKTPINFLLTLINPLIQPFFLMEKTSSKGKV